MIGKTICKLLLKAMGWKWNEEGPSTKKCILCVAPHTSQWDFIIGKLYYTALGRDASFLIKKEFFVFPFKSFWHWIGGIPVDRGRNNSLVEQVAAKFKSGEITHIAITPEGTRKLRHRWKRGFLYMAKEADVPIALLYLDYGKKEIGVGPLITPSDDMDADMIRIKTFYKNVQAKHPEKFSTGLK